MKTEPHSVTTPRRRHVPTIARATVLLVAGLVGFFHEVFVSPNPSGVVLFASLALCGLPFPLLLDELKGPSR